MVAQAPHALHTLYANLPESPDKGLNSLPGRVRDTIGKHVNAIVLGLGIMVASNGQVQAANNVPSAPANSAPSAVADKGQQVVTIGGKEYTFAYIATRPVAEQDELIGQITDEKQIEDFANYFDTIGKVANQEGQKIDIEIVASNQRKDGELAGLQVANQTLKVDQQQLIADAIVYMQKVEHDKIPVNPAIIENILKIEENTPGVIPAPLLEWARSHATTTVASIAGR